MAMSYFKMYACNEQSYGFQREGHLLCEAVGFSSVHYKDCILFD